MLKNEGPDCDGYVLDHVEFRHVTKLDEYDDDSNFSNEREYFALFDIPRLVDFYNPEKLKTKKLTALEKLLEPLWMFVELTTCAVTSFEYSHGYDECMDVKSDVC